MGAQAAQAASFTWSPTGALYMCRASHTSTLLPNGKVLVAGGDITSYSLNTAELYNPAPAGLSPGLLELLLL